MLFFVNLRRLVIVVVLLVVVQECGAVDGDGIVKLQDGRGLLFQEFSQRQNERPLQTNSHKPRFRVLGKPPLKSRSSENERPSFFSWSKNHHQHHLDSSSTAYSPLLPLLFKSSVPQEDTSLHSKNETLQLNLSVENSNDRSILRHIDDQMLSTSDILVHDLEKHNEATVENAHLSKLNYIQVLNNDHKLRWRTDEPTTFKSVNKRKETSIQSTGLSAEAASTDINHSRHFDSLSSNHKVKRQNIPSTPFQRMSVIIAGTSPRRLRRDLFIKNERFPELVETFHDKQQAYDTVFDQSRDNEEPTESPRDIFDTNLQQHYPLTPEQLSQINEKYYIKPHSHLQPKILYEEYVEYPKLNRIPKFNRIPMLGQIQDFDQTSQFDKIPEFDHIPEFDRISNFDQTAESDQTPGFDQIPQLYHIPQLDQISELDRVSDFDRITEPDHFDKRSFDSINNGRLSGINQNFNNHFGPSFLGSKPYFFDPHNLAKRQFDAIGTGHFLGISQNHIGKRSFDSTSEAKLPQIFQNQIYKRNFDQIGGGILSGLKQNHVGKRYLKVIPTDSILDKVGQNIVDRMSDRLVEKGSGNSETVQNILENGEFGSISSDNRDGVMNVIENPVHAELFGKHMDELTNSKDDLIFNNEMRISSQDTNMIYPNENTRYEDLGPPFVEKRLDAINNAALGDIGHKFWGKEYNSAFQKESLPDYRKNVIQPRYYNSFGRRHLEAARQNMIQNIKFGLLSPSVLWGLDNNVKRKRNFPIYLSNHFRGFGKGFPEKRSFDTISISSMNPFDQNFIDRQKIDNRRFIGDSISDNYMNGLSPNFHTYSKNNFIPANRLNKVSWGLFKKHWFPLNSIVSLNGPRNFDLFPSRQIEEDEKRHFLSKRTRGVTKLDDGLDGLNEDSSENSLKMYYSPLSRFGYSKWGSPGDLLQADSGIMDSTLRIGQGDDDTAQSGSTLLKVRDDYFQNVRDYFARKRSFDRISSLSSLSAMDQNFVEPTRARKTQLEFSQRRSLPKRNSEVDGSILKMKETGDISFEHSPDVLLGDWDKSNRKGLFEKTDKYLNVKIPRLNKQRFVFRNIGDNIGGSELEDKRLDFMEAPSEGDGSGTSEKQDGDDETKRKRQTSHDLNLNSGDK